jgi:GxxExxY protein
MELKYGNTTGKIIGAAMKVHTQLGNGFQEVIYQRALEIQLAEDGIPFEREFTMPIFYNEQQIGERRVDFLIEDNICVELKAIEKLEPANFTQAKNYLEAYNKEIGLLINFGAMSLEYKRIENRKFKAANKPTQ